MVSCRFLPGPFTHRMVLKALDVDIKHMHGYVLKTHTASQWEALQAGAEAGAALRAAGLGSS